MATVAINNSVNAALLAARILGVDDKEARMKVAAYMTEMEMGVLDKAGRIESLGWEEYAAGMK